MQRLAKVYNIDNEMVQYLLNKVDYKSTIALQELNENMRIDLPNKPHVLHQALSKALDGHLISIKDVRSYTMEYS